MGAVVSRDDDGTLTVELESGIVELAPKLARQLYVAVS